jgi:hypothetical protein
MKNGLISYNLLDYPGIREYVEKRAYFNWLNGYSEDPVENWNEAVNWLLSLRG